MTQADREDLDRIAALVKAADTATLTTVNLDGQLVSRPLAIQEVPFEGDLWFFTQDPSEKTDEIAHNPQVNVALGSGKGFLSLAGTATVTHDAQLIDDLWTTSAEAWFPNGRDDSVALICVTAETVEYWATDDPKPLVLLKVAKAAVTGGQPDIGENKTVEL